MKRKNTEASVGTLLATGLLILIMSLLAGAVIVGVLRGRPLKLIDPSQPLPLQLLRWAIPLAGCVLIFKSAGSSLWLWWTELREIAHSARARVKGWWKKPLTALILLALIASGPFWLIRIDADTPEEWMLLYALYLFFAGLITVLPCSLIYGLSKSLAEKEMEKEELDEAKKY